MAHLELVVVSGKGGVGKSLVAASIALLLSVDHGKRVVALDADADAPNLAIAMGVDRWDSVEEYHEGCIARIDLSKCVRCYQCVNVCTFRAIDIVDQNPVVDGHVCEGCGACVEVCPRNAIKLECDVLAGYIKVSHLNENLVLISTEIVPGRPASGKIVVEGKNRVREMAKKLNSNFIVVDASAGIGCAVVSALSGSDLAIVVAEPTKASLVAVERIAKLLKHFAMPGILVVNKFDLNEAMTKFIEDRASQLGIVPIARIPYDDAVPQALTIMKPPVFAYPTSRASIALRDLVKRILEIAERWDEWSAKHRPVQEPYIPKIVRS